MPHSLFVPLLKIQKRHLMTKSKNIHKTNLCALYFAPPCGKMPGHPQAGILRLHSVSSFSSSNIEYSGAQKVVLSLFF